MKHGINGIDLSQLFVQKPGGSKVRVMVKYALAGNPIVFEDSLPIAGSKVILYGESDRGTLPLSTIWQLEDLKNVPNKQYPAVVSGQAMKIRFCNEDEAITYQMVINSPIPKETQRVHSIQIKLMIMEYL